jgi:hypothetical protein
MTIVFDSSDLPQLHAALVHCESVADALSQTALVDAGCCGLTRDSIASSRAEEFVPTALATGRGFLGWATKFNVPTVYRHASLGSPAYERHLWTSARRHGFAVLDPVQLAADEHVSELRAAAHICHPYIISNTDSTLKISGITWLIFADEGCLGGASSDPPLTMKDRLDRLRRVTDRRPLSSVIANLVEGGAIQRGSDDNDFCAFVTEDDTPANADDIVFDPEKIHGVDTTGDDGAALFGTPSLDEFEIPRRCIHQALAIRSSHVAGAACFAALQRRWPQWDLQREHIHVDDATGVDSGGS